MSLYNSGRMLIHGHRQDKSKCVCFNTPCGCMGAASASKPSEHYMSAFLERL